MAKNKFSLGKGLSALIPDADTTSSVEPSEISAKLGSVAMISLSDIAPNPLQPRKDFAPESLGELVESIRSHGIIQPVTVRRTASGRYELISGERRVRASRIVGLDEIPAYIIDVDTNRRMLEMAIVENVQRQNLNPLEEAESYRRLIEECGLRQDEVAERIAKDRTTVSNFLRLLKLPIDIQESLRKGELGMGHAKAIMAIPDTTYQVALWKTAVKESYSVRRLEELARKAATEHSRSNGSRKRSGRPMKESLGESAEHLAPMENALKQKLQTQVRIRMKNQTQGEIALEFYSIEDLERLNDLLHTAETE
ncbi:MAG TPA: ParB/RepB/Spo0J family partition protein [Candidatus Kapabacteria bacterium]|nr:ParB/RepB/Spo0J family partition protein [Candidatus Kapabacteria bacterium]